MNRTLETALGILVTAGVGAGLWVGVIAKREAPPPAPPRELGPIPVRTRALVEETREHVIEAFGQVRPARTVLLTAEVAGRVAEVHPDWVDGASVEEGELLFAVEETEARLAMDVVQARAREAEAASRAAEIDLERAQRVLTQAEARLALAQREAERREGLQATGAVSESEAEGARSRAVDAELFAEESRVGVSVAGAALERARARGATAMAELRQAEDRLARTRVVAPFRGRLVGAAPALGERLMPGAPVGELYDFARPRAVVQVSEVELPSLAIGLAAHVSFPGSPDVEGEGLVLPAHVIGVTARTDPLTRRGGVELALEVDPETAKRLPAGLFVRARIGLGQRSGVSVARAHIVWVDGDPCAFVLEAEGNEDVARLRRLTLAREEGEGFIVADGLASGETLILSPLDRLSDGAVCVLREDSAPSSLEAGR